MPLGSLFGRASCQKAIRYGCLLAYLSRNYVQLFILSVGLADLNYKCSFCVLFPVALRFIS
jgi:hypothetical protein